MELQVSREKLRQCKLFVATPCYGGMQTGLFAKSCIDLQALCFREGIDVKFSMLFNESLIPRGRAYLADEFLRSGFTHMLFIDADIHFDPNWVLTLLAMDKDIAGAPYPKKTINWDNVKKAVIRNYEARQQNIKDREVDPNIPEVADIDPSHLAAVVGSYVFNPVAGTQSFAISEPLKVLEIGTGFMMIKRNVFDAFKEAYPTLAFKPDHQGQSHFDGSRYIHMYFPCLIDRLDELVGGGTDRYLSEDYAFCQLARKIGFDIWLMPWMNLGHIGTIEFQGNLPAIGALVGSIS